MDIPRKPAKKNRRWAVYGGAAILLLVVTKVALARIGPAAPPVDRATLWMDTVRSGDMVRQVRG
ncbi:MAG TPA: hypothetical protein VFQ39_00970, partial [Longimicrobium sp.]|nr:hypothetical protein [Longimicrobium sp.]